MTRPRIGDFVELDEWGLCQVVQLIDISGEDTTDPERACAFVAQLPDSYEDDVPCGGDSGGKWFNGAIDMVERVVFH